MKGWVAGVFLVATASLAAQAPAKITSEEDYSKTMKEVAQNNMKLGKSVASTSEADVRAASERLETIFKSVQAYWESKKVDDATTFAKNAVAAAHSINTAAEAHDMAAAATAAGTLRAQCASCHMAHREQQPDKTFKMK
jgi:cytochrome c556